MAQRPKAFHPGLCDITLGVDGFNDAVVDSVQQTFELNPNYEEVYIIHDSSTAQEFLHDSSISNPYGLRKYKTWIYDGTEDEQTVGHKYIQMYPYDNIILQEGDYISFDYYHDGTKTTWFCTALDSTSQYEQIGKIRPCTNEVRFINDNGEYIRIPCVFDNKINSEKNTSLSNLKYINGITTIYMQSNPDTDQLRPNQRLLFGRPGQWTAFRVVSVGVDNFINQIFWDNNSARVIEVTMEASYVNYETDDVVNGIADVVKFSINLSTTSLALTVGQTSSVYGVVIKNDTEDVDKEIVWSSSNNRVASVDELGNVTANTVGKCVITAKMQDNEDVTAKVTVVVSDTAENAYDVVITPYEGNSYGIIQGDSQVFTCHLYNNGVVQDAEFEFTLTTEANEMCYRYEVIDGNHFRINNLRMCAYPLTITCTSGEYTKDVSIILKGAW